MAAAASSSSTTTDEEWVRRRPGQMYDGTHFLLTGPRDATKLVVCVPGIGGIHMYYDELEPALVAQHYRVLRFDLMGRGFSEAPPGHGRKPPACCGGCVPLEQDPYSLEGHVQQLHGLLFGLRLIQGGSAPQDLDASASVSSVSASTSTSTATNKGLEASSSQTWPQQHPARAAVTAHGLPTVPEAAAIAAAAPPTKPFRQIHLIGHSMGGAISVGFADRYPELVASLTLLTPAGLMDRGQFRLLRALPCCIQRLVQASLRRQVDNAVRNDFLVHNTPLEERVLKLVRALHLCDWWMEVDRPSCAHSFSTDPFPPKTHKITQVHFHLKHNPSAHDALFRSILAFPLSGLDDAVQRVAATRVPTLVIWAIFDRVLPFEPHFARWKALLKTGNNVRYEVIEDACHGFPLERPERTNQIVLRFLKAPPTFLPSAVLHSLQSNPPTITI